MRLQRTTAAGLALLAVGITATTAAYAIAVPPAARVTWTFLLLSVPGLVVAGLGVAIAVRVPCNRVGVLLSWVGAIVAFLAARPAYESIALLRPDIAALNLHVVVLFEESAWWLLAAVALVLLYFPNGRLPSPRWRFVPPTIVACAATQQAYGIVEDTPLLGPLKALPRPYGKPPLVVDIVANVTFGLLLVLAVACICSLVVRYRGSTGELRAQLKWLSLAGFAWVGYPFVCAVELVLTGHTGPVAIVVGIVALVSLPISIAVAMLRHNLYDVDRALAASLTYAIATVALVTLFAASTVIVGLVLGRDSAATAAVATAICALVLSPLRVRVHRLVDRRFYPPRRAAIHAIETLQQRIHAGRAQPEELEATLRSALRDPGLRVGLRLPGTHSLVDAQGAPITEGGLVPVILAGEQVGVLVSPTEAGTAVLRAVASSTASLIEVMRLRAELAAALREVRESRARLVYAGNAERVRLERDLHDGAQVRLVSLGMAIRIAQLQLASGTVDVDGVLDRAVTELGTAVAELRQIAHGLRPTSLDDGLHAALSGLTRSMPVPIQLDIDAQELPDDLATTAYFVASEAVTNAAKHAGAERVAVRVDRSGEALRIRVEDDGCGGAAARPGSGLAGLADRVAAVGGSMTMRSPRGGGTVIEAVLPCG